VTAQERILCAAIYVDTGAAEPPRRSYAYPKTGLVFAGWRHGDCFVTLDAWWYALSDEGRFDVFKANGHIRSRHQGFVTSRGRFVDRAEAGEIAYAAGQTEKLLRSLTSEDIY